MNAARQEQSEKFQPVSVQSVSDNQSDHEQCQRRCDDHMAGNGKEVGEHAQKVGHENKCKEREDYGR